MADGTRGETRLSRGPGIPELVCQDRGSAILLLSPTGARLVLGSIQWTGRKSTVFLAAGHLLQESLPSPVTLSHRTAVPNP